MPRPIFNEEDYFNNPDKFVFPFVIQEKNKERTIITYNKGQYGESLRRYHERALEWFNDSFAERNEHSFAYHKGVRCADALKEHLKSNFFIKLDIHKFFESITEELFFEKYGEYFNKKITNMIKCCFYKGSLSIGFVTSPSISDFFMKGFDKKIENYVKEHPETHYSRYSDDILLSSEETDDDKSLNDLFSLVKKELKALKLEINPKKLFKTKLSYQEHNSISYLGLGISKLDDIDNKVTISKRYILFLLSLIKKNKKYGSKCKGLLDEINSRVAYLAYNSPISYARFQKKHLNTFGVEYEFTPRKPLDRVQPLAANELPNFGEYAQMFEFELHDKISNTKKYGFTKLDAITIKKYLCRTEQVVTIPKFVDSIGPGAFRFHPEVKEIIFEGNIKHIANSAFERCDALKKIVLPDSLRYIGKSAFQFCHDLSEIVVPKRIKTIEPYTFNNTGLKNIILPEGLKEIRQSAFEGCELNTITLPASLEVLGSYAFQRCKNLTSIAFSEGLLKIDNSAFANCTNLKEVILPESLLEIEPHVFDGCDRLQRVVIPDNVVSIRDNAFDNCPILNDIVINNNRVFSLNKNGDLIETATEKIILYRSNVIDSSMKAIPDDAFAGSTISKVVIPEGVTTIGNGAFMGCYLLKEVKLPSTLKTIGGAAFMGCISLKKIIIPEGVKIININAFANCTKLEKVVLPEGLITIGENAFDNDQLLKDINVPNSVSKIDKHAFKYCYSIKKLFLSENVKKLHKKAFYGCSYSLESIKVSPLNTVLTSGQNSNTIIVRKTGELILGCKNSRIEEGVNIIYNHAFVNCLGLKKVVLPKSTTIIQKGAFKGCLDLEKVDLGNVYTIDKNAFEGDEKIVDINLPETLTKLGEGAFLGTNIKALSIPASLGNYVLNDRTFNLDVIEVLHISAAMKQIAASGKFYLPNLKKVTVDKNNDTYGDDGCDIIRSIQTGDIVLGSAYAKIPSGKEAYHIRPYAFSNIRGLKKIVVPKNCILDNECFAGCPDLKEVVIESEFAIPAGAFRDCSKLEKVTFNAKTTVIGDWAFANCGSLKSISLPPSLNRIGRYSFCNAALKEINIPNKVETIDMNAFAGCSKLKDISLSNNLKMIGNSAFAMCSSLEKIVIPNKVKAFGSSMFNECKNLKEIVFPKSLTVIPVSAFRKCNSLKEIVLPKSISEICSNAFADCEALEKVVMADKVKKIDNGAFISCKSLKSINLSSSLESIYVSAFKGCTSLRSIDLPDSLIIVSSSAFAESGIESVSFGKKLVSLGETVFKESKKLKKVSFAKDSDLKVIPGEAFYGCSALEEVILPNKLVEIGKLAFAECPKLKPVKLPESLEIIRNSAFAFDTRIKEIYLPRALTIFNNNAYYGCGINKITVHKLNKYFQSINDNTLIIKKHKVTEKPALMLGTKKSIIPEDVTLICASAFVEVDDKREELVIPKNVEVIGQNAFKGWNSLKRLTLLGDNVKEFHQWAFRDSPLENFVLPRNTMVVGTQAFSKTKIKKLHLDKNVCSFSTDAFDFSELETILVNDDNEHYTSLNANALIRKKDKTVVLTCRNSSLLPEGVESISSMTNYPSYDEVFIPQSLERISYAALKDVDVKKFKVDKKNPYFITDKNGTALIRRREMALVHYSKDGILPEGIKDIFDFSLNENAKKLYIPSSLKNITDIANLELSNIEEIEVSKDNPYFDSRDNCNAIIDSKTNTLLVASKNTVIPESVHKIARGAYVGRGITKIYIPKQIDYIDLAAFSTLQRYESIKVDKDNPVFALENRRNLIVNKNYSNNPGAILYRFMLTIDQLKVTKTPKVLRVAYSGEEYDGLTKEERAKLNNKSITPKPRGLKDEIVLPENDLPF